MRKDTKNILLPCLILVDLAVSIIPASAAETTTYTYDAKGQLVKVERSGTVNNGVKVEYTYDKAGNRLKVKVTGAP